MPVNNARYALNAGNARWGSLYDALYGTDAIADGGGAARGHGFNKVRAARVVRRRQFDPCRRRPLTCCAAINGFVRRGSRQAAGSDRYVGTIGMVTLIFAIVVVLTWSGAWYFYFRRAIALARKQRRVRRANQKKAAELARKAQEKQTAAWMKAYEAKKAQADGKPAP